MKIANPIYDLAFKYLMENERMAKLVLSTILEQDVVNVYFGSQEVVVPKPLQYKTAVQNKNDTNRDDDPLTVFRLDFKAEIKNKAGEIETVLIEIQKARTGTEITRFRSYLGSNYLKGVEEIDDKGNRITRHYPIVTIYILGYNLPGIPYLGIAIERQTLDMTTGQPVSAESEFIDKLNHRSYILQIRNLPPERRTRLEKFMSLFNQAWVAETNYILNLEEVPEEFTEIADYMHSALADEQFVTNMQGEWEMKDYQTRLETAIITAEEAKERAEEAKTREEEERRQKEEERRQKEEERRQKEDVEKVLYAAVIELQKTLPVERIAVTLGVSIEVVEQIINNR